MTKQQANLAGRITIWLTVISLALGNVKQFVDIGGLQGDKEDLNTEMIYTDSLNYELQLENKELHKENGVISKQLSRCLGREHTARTAARKVIVKKEERRLAQTVKDILTLRWIFKRKHA